MIETLDSINANVPIAENEYLAEDGLMHCSVCHEPVQLKVEVLGVKRTVRCVCKCHKEAMALEAEREKAQNRYRMRMSCFKESNMHTWTFDNDDNSNPKLSDAMKAYAKFFPEFKKKGHGLLLYGPVGTGKSFMAACVANALIDKEIPVFMTNFATLTNKLQGMFDGKQEYIDSLNRYSLLIIDDLGAERKTEYMAETVFNIIDSRYRAGLPMIITTNLTAEELKKPQDVAYTRIYDRVLERCHPIKVDGNSRRREKLKREFAETQKILGL